MNHGAPDAAVRHVGDLGNVEADASGRATLDIVDKQISLKGDHSVIGRCMVVSCMCSCRAYLCNLSRVRKLGGFVFYALIHSICLHHCLGLYMFLTFQYLMFICSWLVRL